MSKCTHCETTGVIGVMCDRCRIAELKADNARLLESWKDINECSEQQVKRIAELEILYDDARDMTELSLKAKNLKQKAKVNKMKNESIKEMSNERLGAELMNAQNANVLLRNRIAELEAQLAEATKYETELHKCTELIGEHWLSSISCNGLLQVAGHLGNILAQLAKYEWVSVEDMPDFLMQPYPASDSEWDIEFYTLDHYAEKVIIKSAQEIWLNEDSEVEWYKPIHLPEAKLGKCNGDCKTCIMEPDYCGNDHIAGSGKKVAQSSFIQYLREQKEWSKITFGSGRRTKGLIDHIKKELVEIKNAPTDLFEWVDVIILGLDGAWRAGWSEDAIYEALWRKLTINKNREWNVPDSEDEAVEHVRDTGKKVCKWEHCETMSDGFDDYYETSCGLTFEFNDGTWHENGYRYCPCCKLEIKESEAENE